MIVSSDHYYYSVLLGSFSIFLFAFRKYSDNNEKRQKQRSEWGQTGASGHVRVDFYSSLFIPSHLFHNPPNQSPTLFLKKERKQFSFVFTSYSPGCI